MKKRWNRILAGLLAIVMVLGSAPLTGIGNFVIDASAASVQRAIFPISELNVSQGYDGSFSHKGLYNVDYVGGGGVLKAPFDCVVVLWCGDGWDEYTYGHTVIIQSLQPVQFADGTVDYMTIATAHDNDIKDLHKGKTLKQGEVYYHMGNCGFATGVHVDLCVAKGRFFNDAEVAKIQAGILKPNWTNFYERNYQQTNKNGSHPNNRLKNSIAPEKAFFVPSSTKITKSGGYNWIRGDSINLVGIYKALVNGLKLKISKSFSSSNTDVPIQKGQTYQITEVDGNWGKTTVNGQTGFVYLDMNYNEFVPSLPAPSAASVSANKSGTTFVGDSVTVSWSAKNADQYDVRLMCDGVVLQNLTNQTRTSTVFSLGQAGTYSVSVTARNAAGSTSADKRSFVVAKAPSTVTFRDWDDKVLGTQSVVYNKNATAPQIPSREGYTFTGWDRTLNNITTDTVIRATYKINTYTIQFVDADGTVLKKQRVEYLKDAVPPENTNPAAGYIFFGWNSESYKSVKSDATIRGIYYWENENIPITLSSETANRQKDGYHVAFELKNNTDTGKTWRGRAVITLKTAEGKLVDTTESAAFSLAAKASKSFDEFVPCDQTATVAEIIVVEGYQTGIPLSQMKSIPVNQGTEWSGWSDSKPDTSVYTDVESRTVYRYSDMQTTTSSASSLSGWSHVQENGRDKYDDNSHWSNYGGWSNWQDAVVHSSDSREVDTQTVVASNNYKTVYHFWKYSKSQYAPEYSNVPTTTYGKNYYTYTTDDPSMFKNPQSVSYNGRKDTLYSFCYNGKNWFSVYEASPFATQEIVSTNYKTQYRFRDRQWIPSYTYYYFRWTDWSSWSTSAVSGSGTRQVQTKTQWRYKNTFAGAEDTAGAERHVSGQLDASYAGKQATLFVYKVYEASDWTNGFVGQTKIAADGSYAFDFKLREEPTVRTGDFTIALGIEGTDKMTVIGTIEAPKPTYTVTFYDADGNVIGEPQQVTQGESAAVPETVPEKEGFTFVGWSDTTTNVRGDMDVQAQYMRNTYTVTFVNWLTHDVEQREFAHGESVNPPEQKDVEGYDFVGWSGVVIGETVATEDMISEAQYEKKTYDVTVYDYNGEILNQLAVAYDDCVELDMNYKKAHSIFLGWEDLSGQPLNAVHADMEIYPRFVFEETTEPPYASIESGTFSEAQNVELFCDTQDAVIFYTIDGSDPLQSPTAVEYTKPIPVSHSLELRFAASCFAKNDSAVVTEKYAVNTEDTISKWMPFDDIPLYVKERADDYTFYADTGYKYKNEETTSSLSAIEQFKADGWTEEGMTLGEQSAWQKTQPDLPDTAYELIVDEHPQVEAQRFRYTHFKYIDAESGEYAYNNTEVDGVSGEWEEYLSETRLAAHKVGTLTYYEYDGAQWFNQTTVNVMVDADYKLYSYKLKTYTFSKWTDWTPDAPAAGDTREYETTEIFQYIVPEMAVVTVRSENEEAEPQTVLAVVGKPLVYATQDKTLSEAKAAFETRFAREGYDITAFRTQLGTGESVPVTVWSAWSDWQDEAVTGSSSREVETRKILASYDYKTTYHFWKYSKSQYAPEYSNVPTTTYGKNYYTYTTDDPSMFKNPQNVSYNGRNDTLYSFCYNGTNWFSVYADSPFETQEVVSTNYKTQYRYRDSVTEIVDKAVWDLAQDKVTGAMTLYVQYEMKTFTVNFRDAQGNVLDTQTVNYGEDAVPPAVETPSGSSFVRWDSDAWRSVTADADVTAIVKPDNEIVRVTLSRSKFTTMVGSAFALRATVANVDEEHGGVTWSSDNELVAYVTENGAVNAVGAGTATITATAYDGTTASCAVTVMRNTDNELYLKEDTVLKLDANGKLRNVPLLTDTMLSEHKAETAGFVKAQFVNDDVTVVDIHGHTLEDDAPVGTGSAVLIRDGGTVVDKREIVITGDFDGDGAVSNRDAAKIVACVVGKETASYIQMLAIDVNGDGSINGRDASMLSRYLVGKETL